MTEPDLPAPQPDTLAETEPALHPVEPGYRTVLRIQWAMLMVPISIGAIVVDLAVLRGNGLPWGFLSVAALLLTLLAITVTAARQYGHLGYTLGADDLRVVRGYAFHTDTLVPFVRVQHIDVGQGPVERLCGVAHLVVHTAGTHNSIVTLPGLSRATAETMRDSIRRHIQTDFA
jgi:hypothetical protein